jgi:Protein of unknown function (DUF732)
MVWTNMAIRRPVARLLATVLPVLAWWVAAVVGAGPVRASAQDYLDNLHRLGINVPGGDVELLEWGFEACKLLELGKDYQDARAQAIYNSSRGPLYDMTVAQADAVMHYAMADLCQDGT